MNRRAIASIRFLSTLIMAIAAVVSYETQRGLLLGWQVDQLSSAAIPVTVDLLAIICTIGAHLDGVSPVGRRIAYRVLAVAGTASIAANVASGVTWGSRIAHAWTVVAYLLAELVAAKVKAGATVAPVVPVPVDVHPVDAVTAPTLPAAPVSPAAPSHPTTTPSRPVWAPAVVPSPVSPMRRTATSPLTGQPLTTGRR